MDPIDAQLQFVLAGHRLRAFLEARVSDVSNGRACLTYHRYLVLEYISQHKRCSRRDISYGVGIPEGTLTGIPDYLLKHGLVHEEIIQYERVQRRLTITDAGLGLVSRAREALARAAAEVANEVGADVLHMLAVSASKVLTALPLPDRFQAQPYSPPPARRRRLQVKKI